MGQRKGASTLLAISVLIFLPPSSPALGQETGTVTGRVTDATTGRALESARVSHASQKVGTLTDARGHFVLPEVPAGPAEISAEVTGFIPATSSLTVVAGTVVEVDFHLVGTGLKLQELVRTGLVGETPRVKLPFAVERITADDLIVFPPSVGGMLSGKVVGAKVVRGSGQPGSDPGILLRGPTTITGTQDPLFIVDGVVTENPLADIGSQDVESVEVIKGAAAASLYGSKGQNGVVQVRTKRGENLQVDQTRFIFRSEYGRESIGGSVRKTRGHWFETNASGDPLDVEGNVVRDVLTHKQTTGQDLAETAFHDKKYPANIPLYDHADQLFGPGSYVSQNVAVEGRTSSTNYRVSFSYLDEAGVLPDFNDGSQRKGFRLNLDQFLGEDLTLGVSAYYAQTDQEALSDSPFFSWAHQNPVMDLLRRDPSTKGLSHCPSEGCLLNLPGQFDREENPLYSLELLDLINRRNRLMGNLGLVWFPRPWLELRGDVALDRLESSQSETRPAGYTTEQGEEEGAIFNSQTTSNDLNASVSAALDKTYGNLRVRTRLRYLTEDQNRESLNVRGTRTQYPDVPVLDNAGIFRAGSSIEQVRSEGVLLVTALDLEGKYLSDFLLRREGSSVFGSDQRWQTYFRASGAWRLAQEEWWPFQSVEEFKLRYAIGSAGRRPEFAAQYETYRVTGAGVFRGTLDNEDLKPERTREQEVGVEFVISGEIHGGAQVVWTMTEDQLLLQPLPSPAGFATQWANAGAVEGRSYEAYLQKTFQGPGGLSWTSRVLFDRTRKRISALRIPAFPMGEFFIREGEEMGSLYGLRWATRCRHLPAGTDCTQFQVNDDGLLVWVGRGNSFKEGFSQGLWFSTTNIPSADGQVTTYAWGMPIQAVGTDRSGNRTSFLRIGNTTPAFDLRWSNTLRWNSFTLFFLFEGEFGADVYNRTRAHTYRDGVSRDQDQSEKPDELKKPVHYYDALYNLGGTNSWFAEDGTFLKLRELAVRFSLDQHRIRSWLDAVLGLDGLSLTLTGRNLVTWTGYDGFDPEVGSGLGGSPAVGRVDDAGYPNFRTIGLSIEAVF